MSQRDKALAALAEIHRLAVVHAGTACWKAILKHMPLLKAAIEESRPTNSPILSAKPQEGELLWADRGSFNAVDEWGRTVRCVSALSCSEIERERNKLRTRNAKLKDFTKLATLIDDINIDRYGRPLIAALHLCNDLADDLYRARLSQPEGP